MLFIPFSRAHAEAAKVARFRDEMNATERAMAVLRAQLRHASDARQKICTTHSEYIDRHSF